MQSQYFTVAQISTHIEMTPEGFLLCKDVPIMRAGELAYDESETPITPDGSGATIINRPRNVLQDAVTIASFEGKPVTLGHPPEGVTPENYKDVAVGSLQNVRAGHGEMQNFLISDMLINDRASIEKVLSGELREVSIGGAAQYLEFAPGSGEQKSLIGNHVALVREGRAGPSCAIQDSKGDDMSFQDKIKAIFKRAADESCQVLDEAMPKDAVESQKESKDETVKELQANVNELKVSNTAILKSFDELKVLLTSKAEEKESEQKESKEEAETVEPDLETISRAEILAPGIAKVGDVKTAALKAFYATADGKTVMDPLLAGRDMESVDKDMLFVTAAEMVKANRRSLIADSAHKGNPGAINKSLPSIDKMNETNKNFWKGAK